jgi:hypothetical protein
MPATAAAKDSTKTPAIAGAGASRRIEGLIRDYLLRKEAKGIATIVACSRYRRNDDSVVSSKEQARADSSALHAMTPEEQAASSDDGKQY